MCVMKHKFQLIKGKRGKGKERGKRRKGEGKKRKKTAPFRKFLDPPLTTKVRGSGRLLPTLPGYATVNSGRLERRDVAV